MALAGVFQSAAMVQQVARTGELPEKQYRASIHSIFELNPESVESIYRGPANLSLGFEVLHCVLNRTEANRYNDTIRYCIGLLHIERLLSKNPDLLQILRSRIEQISNQLCHFDNNELHPSIIAKLADLYVDTLGTFTYRIQVKGDPQQLQQEQTAHKVRAILLAGVRSAMLWRQLGGSRFQLLFGKSKIIRALNELRAQADIAPKD